MPETERCSKLKIIYEENSCRFIQLSPEFPEVLEGIAPGVKSLKFDYLPSSCNRGLNSRARSMIRINTMPFMQQAMSLGNGFLLGLEDSQKEVIAREIAFVIGHEADHHNHRFSEAGIQLIALSGIMAASHLIERPEVTAALVGVFTPIQLYLHNRFSENHADKKGHEYEEILLPHISIDFRRMYDR